MHDWSDTSMIGAAPGAGYVADTWLHAAGDADALPEGWAAAQDGQGRTYYWHKRTQKTQWDRPTADTLPE